MSLGIMVNPYSHFEMWQAEDALSHQARYTWTHAGAESIETLQHVFRLGLEAGADTIMLRADDFVPHEGRNRMNFSLYTPEDRERFVNLQNAQAHVINRLKAWIDRDYPGTRFEFCPPWYLNEFIDRSGGKAEVYMKELAALIPQAIAIIWTGPTVRSLSIDMADLRRYRDLIGRWPMLWDNTLYARNLETDVYGGYTTYYPGKVAMCSLFEPLDADFPAAFHELNDGRHMYVNGSSRKRSVPHKVRDSGRLRVEHIRLHPRAVAVESPGEGLRPDLRQGGPALQRGLLWALPGVHACRGRGNRPGRSRAPRPGVGRPSGATPRIAAPASSRRPSAAGGTCGTPRAAASPAGDLYLRNLSERVRRKSGASGAVQARISPVDVPTLILLPDTIGAERLCGMSTMEPSGRVRVHASVVKFRNPWMDGFFGFLETSAIGPPSSLGIPT